MKTFVINFKSSVNLLQIFTITSAFVNICILIYACIFFIFTAIKTMHYLKQDFMLQDEKNLIVEHRFS